MSVKKTEKCNSDRAVLENQTGALFSKLWPAYDDKLFEESVNLFFARLDDWGISRDFFKNKTCLDAGCGGGRNSIAMARLGAKYVYGIDLGKQGIKDARKRAGNIKNVSFQLASVLEPPFEDNKFDRIWFAGVLMITADPQKALEQLYRVLKPGGSLYLLVYANGGMRWPLVELLRKLALDIGEENIEKAIELADLPSNKRRTFLDDLFCPVLDFYSLERLEKLLKVCNFRNIKRMPRDKYDHEASLEKFRMDIEAFASLFEAGVKNNLPSKSCFKNGLDFCKTLINTVQDTEKEVACGNLSNEQAMNRIVGQGHHRVWAAK